MKLARSGDFQHTEVLLTGSDDYLHELVLKTLEARFIEPDFKDFNYRTLDITRSTSAGEVSGLLSELPTLVENRLVFLNGISSLNKSHSENLAENFRQDLSPGTILVAAAGGKVADDPFWKALQQSGILVDCKLKEEEVKKLLTSFCRKHKVKADPAALKALQERVGASLRGMVAQLERCVLSLESGQPLTAEIVNKLVPLSAEVALWRMTAAIGRKDHSEALSILDRQLDKGESPGAILGYINSYMSSLVQIGGLARQLGSASAVAQAIPRKKEFQVKKTLEELRTWSVSDLESGFEALARADFKCKGGDGGGDPRLLLQMLILKLCSRKRR